MTALEQLDLPQVSFARYLQLLKRRTWQVVFVSILGLLVGGLVAMLIPRYYVAYTTVQFIRPILDPKLGTPEDPMAQVVENARVTIPGSVEEALEDLRWPEVSPQMTTPEERRTFIENVRKEVVVYDLGPANKRRTVAKLQINYADTNGRRAKELANKLRDVWLRKFVDNLSTDALRDMQGVQEAISKTEQDLNVLATEVQSFERQHELNPDDWSGERKGQLSHFTEQRARTAERLFQLDSSITQVEQAIEFNKSMVEITEPTIALTGADRFEDETMRKRWVQLQMNFLKWTVYLRGVASAHPGYKAAAMNLRAIRGEIAQLEANAGDQRLEKPNPKYVELQVRIRQLTRDLAIGKAERDRLDRLVKRQNQRLEDLPKVFHDYRELLSRRAKVEQDLLDLQHERRNKEVIIRRINTEPAYEVLQVAYQPPAPTVPNRTLVTLAGCLIGLGLAIALILLLDFLQASFKTVPDVEQSLKLPVLGSLSHMETDDERRRVQSRRVRLTIASAILLTLLVCVVTIYYVSPTSLPEIVRNILAVLLGGDG